MLGYEEIENRFGFHAENEVGRLFREFADRLDEIVPDGRTKRVSFTQLEDSAMWANKAVAEQAPVVAE